MHIESNSFYEKKMCSKQTLLYDLKRITTLRAWRESKRNAVSVRILSCNARATLVRF